VEGLIPGVLARHGGELPTGPATGSQGQQPGLLSGELPLGDAAGEHEQHSAESFRGYAEGEDDHDAGFESVRDTRADFVLPEEERVASREAVRQARVYDILDAGPNRRFTIITDEGYVCVHNCTQAVAREVLAEAVLRVDRDFFGHGVDGSRSPAVLSMEDPRMGLIGYVHDELVALVPDSVGDHEAMYEEFERIMLQVPAWATGLPISGEGYVATRYRK